MYTLAEVEGRYPELVSLSEQLEPLSVAFRKATEGDLSSPDVSSILESQLTPVPPRMTTPTIADLLSRRGGLLLAECSKSLDIAQAALDRVRLLVPCGQAIYGNDPDEERDCVDDAHFHLKEVGAHSIQAQMFLTAAGNCSTVPAKTEEDISQRFDGIYTPYLRLTHALDREAPDTETVLDLFPRLRSESRIRAAFGEIAYRQSGSTLDHVHLFTQRLRNSLALFAMLSQGDFPHADSNRSQLVGETLDILRVVPDYLARAQAYLTQSLRHLPEDTTPSRSFRLQ